MKFKVLQDNLRKILRERIEAGELTGLRLAQQTGFKQAHISNFLNRKRGLSIEGMDKVLSVQHLSVLDLLDPSEVNKRASILPPSSDHFENVVLTDPSTAATQHSTGTTTTSSSVAGHNSSTGSESRASIHSNRGDDIYTSAPSTPRTSSAGTLTKATLSRPASMACFALVLEASP